VGLENVNPHEELKRLDERIESATEFAALKPLYFRLNEIIGLSRRFDVQFHGNEIKQRLIARGTLLKQQESFPPPFPTTLRCHAGSANRLRANFFPGYLGARAGRPSEPTWMRAAPPSPPPFLHSAPLRRNSLRPRWQ